MSTEQLEIFIKANVQNLAALSELQGKMAAVGAEAESLRVKTLANGGLGVTGSVSAAGTAEAAQMVGQLEAAGIATQGFRLKTIEAAKEVGILESDGVRAGTNLARTFSSVGAAGANAFERIASSAGMLGVGGSAGLAVGGGLVVAGGLYELGRAAVENSEKAEAANKSLEQSAEAAGRSYSRLKEENDKFLASNRSFIKDQYDAEQALALFTRAGNDEATTTKAMNAALDLATLKHLSLGDAARMIELAMMGNGRAVRELGIDLKTLTVAQDGQNVTAERSQAILNEVSEKVAHGRDTTTELDQASNRLRSTWQRLTADEGPALIGYLTLAADGTDRFLTGTEKWADSAAPAVNNALVGVVRNLKGTASGTDDGQRSWAGYTYSVKEASTTTELASHTAAEHADIIDHVTLTSQVAAHAADEHSDSLRYLQTQQIANRDESFNQAEANERVNREIDAMTTQTQLAAHAWDEHHDAVINANTALLNANTSIQNIRETIAHANAERLDIHVNDAEVQQLKAELQGLFNQQYHLHFASEHDPYSGSGGVQTYGGGFTP